MSEFSDLSWRQRARAMGDDAERMFELTQDRWTRYGLNRPDLNMRDLPLKLRYTPDYLQTHRFAEVVVLGHTGQLKLKVEKLIALNLWDHDLPTDLWVWDSSLLRYGEASVQDVLRALCLDGRGDRFKDDHKVHWVIHRDDLPFTRWHDGTGAHSVLRGE